MTDLRTAAQQALEALEQSETFVPYEGFGMARRKAESKHQAAITALRAALAEQRLTDMEQKMERSIESLKTALAEPVQEPVAWTYEWKHRLYGGSLNVSRARWPESDLWIETPLYAAPPQRKPLTEEEIDNIWDSEKAFADIYAIARAIERAHGIT